MNDTPVVTECGDRRSTIGRARGASPPRRSGALVVLAAVVAATLSACGGPSSPAVASLGPGHGDTTTTTAPLGANPTHLLITWATCVRTHGDPDQSDPSVTDTREIAITLPAGWTVGLGGTSPACRPYLTAAETALRAGHAGPSQSQVTAEKFAVCVRAHGVPDYPTPTNGSSPVHATPGSDLDPNNPTLQAASTLCTRQTGFQSFDDDTPEPGDIVLSLAGGVGAK